MTKNYCNVLGEQFKKHKRFIVIGILALLLLGALTYYRYSTIECTERSMVAKSALEYAQTHFGKGIDISALEARYSLTYESCMGQKGFNVN